MGNSRKGWTEHEIPEAMTGRALKLILKRRLIINIIAAAVAATSHFTNANNSPKLNLLTRHLMANCQ